MTTSARLTLTFAFLFCALPAFGQMPECYTSLAELYELIFVLEDSADQNAMWQHVRVDSIGHSRGDQLGTQHPIYAVKFSDNVDTFEDEATCLIIGHIHAEEVAGLEGVVQFMRLLTHRRGQNPYRDMINNTQIYIIPTMNPDGLEFLFSGVEVGNDTIYDLTWRKNGYKPPELGTRGCNVSPGVGNDSCGVDPNRNFDLNWIWGDTLWHPTAAEPFDYYRGTAPMSEPELQAVWRITDEIKPSIGIVWHSSRSGNVAEKCIVPWKWGEEPDRFKYCPDSAAIARVTGTAEVGYVGSTEVWPGGGGQQYYQPLFFSGRKGAAQDWFYWMYGAIVFTTETSPSTGQIQPPCDDPEDHDLPDLVRTLLPPNEWVVRRLINMPDGTDMNDQGGALAIYTKSEGLPISAEWRKLNTWSPMLMPWYTNEQHGRATFLAEPGTHRIMARKEGYVSDTATAVVSPGAYASSSVELNLRPLPWYTMSLRVENSSGDPIPARIWVDNGFPMWVDLPSGTATISKPVGNYVVKVVPVDDEDHIALFRHFWFGEDESYTFRVPDGDPAMFENFDINGMDNWTTGGPGDHWRLEADTSAMNYGSGLCTTAEGYRTTYPDDANTWCEYNHDINLTDDNAAHLRFDRWGRMDMPDDSLFVEVSVDGGDSWDVAASYSDLDVRWTRDWISLVPWADDVIRLRFRLQSDTLVRELGMRIDNVVVMSGVDLGVSEEPISVPYSYKITGAYPNPFNPSTTVAYEVAAGGPVTFTIHNLLGREVRRFDESLPAAGPHMLRWDGTGASGQALASGLYFVRMQTDQVHSTHKLMLLK